MRKEMYEAPTMEIITIKDDDIITASDNETEIIPANPNP